MDCVVGCASRLCFFLMNFVVFGTSMDWMAVGMSVDYLVKGLKWTWGIHAQLTENSSDKFLCVLNLFNRQFQGFTPRKTIYIGGDSNIFQGGPTFSRGEVSSCLFPWKPIELGIFYRRGETPSTLTLGLRMLRVWLSKAL